jgi:4a-hydroxytetrahydrobiopterin dehydratase
MEKISPKQLKELVNWSTLDNTIVKSFSFSSFKKAIEFVNQLAIKAEEHHHHPEINIDFNRVNISLTTKDCGEITKKDFVLAQEIDTLIKK